MKSYQEKRFLVFTCRVSVYKSTNTWGCSAESALASARQILCYWYRNFARTHSVEHAPEWKYLLAFCEKKREAPFIYNSSKLTETPF